MLAAHVAVWRAVTGPVPYQTSIARPHGVASFLAPVAETWRTLVVAVRDASAVDIPGPLTSEDTAVLFDPDGAAAHTHAAVRVSVRGSNLVLTARRCVMGPERAAVLARMYRLALMSMAADPDGSTGASLLPPAERRRLLSMGRAPQIPAPREAVHEAVAGQARNTPDTVAVQAGPYCLTYRELDRRARAWAVALTAAGVRRGALVGVAMPREAELVAAVLGILHAGAVYVPVDPQHPAERLVTMLREAEVRTLVVGDATSWSLPGGPATVLSPAEVPDVVGSADPIRSGADDLIYVVHTSGSTGTPKGVMARHTALADRVASMRRNVTLSAADVLVVVVPMTTDVAQLAIFLALTTGARLVLAAEDLARDPRSLADLLRRSGATFMQASPTTWRMLLECGWTPPAGFRLLSGGEAMSGDLLDRLRATEAQVWNMYGPNEGTVFCFGTRLTGAAAPAWQPAANTPVYLLDDQLDPVLPGVTGQIWIGGSGLARGYLNRSELTAAAFRPDPYASETGARMYATGDLGRWLPDGQIEIIGRRDHQLKVRGHRVELGEVETTLARHPGVRAAVAHPVPGPAGEPQLAGYLLLRPGTSAAQVSAYAGRHLPEYMVPTHLVVLDSFRRLPNGKVDRSALPVPERGRSTLTPYAPPASPAEEAVAQVWASALGIDRVGRDDDFFALGGHSLMTVRIIERLRQAHALRVTFRDFLTRRTVRGVAATAVAAVAAVAADSRTHDESALVWLSTSGSRTPLFCLHPGGGSAQWYLDLADTLAPERPLAAFEWPGLHGGPPGPRTVAELAGVYLAEMRAAQPAGPYHLLGWCGSSGIAWAMASRLHAEGEQVRLILLDPTVDTALRDDAALLHNVAVFRRAERYFTALRDGPPDDGQRRDVHDELLAVLRNVAEDAESLATALADEAGLGDAWAQRLRAWRGLLEVRLDYRFPQYPGQVDLILCEELATERYQPIVGHRLDEYLAQWRRLADGGVTIHRVPGDHRSAVRPPHVRALASTLEEILIRPDTGRAPARLGER
ncbi:amino acid adenylation domain-containing protein [Verrucosispora sp. SN26_14.1]|uniref:non-ribosomal peptide synthetase n=1 Tax=Verrucosispora sp. SN26_14.1 TaxID=2527879 RepID=UPI00103379FD|nr:amino acid adenylation domain-containing protein [Verrucosispora sp. SN26_14.1]TBL45457.1 amino acid adenylation domain-containing protein [Verrucosispora sp. SN26_14.1]